MLERVLVGGLMLTSGGRVETAGTGWWATLRLHAPIGVARCGAAHLDVGARAAATPDGYGGGGLDAAALLLGGANPKVTGIAPAGGAPGWEKMGGALGLGQGT